MKKRRLLALLIGTLLPLTSCTLFNDDDLKYENKFSPVDLTHDEDNPDAIKVHNVIGTKTEYVENTMLFRDVFYGNDEEKVVNTYKTGGINFNELNVNDGLDYDANYDDNVYDLYVPDTVKSNLVLLFIHGGAWVRGDKVDMNQYAHEFAAKGYITATMSYSLLSIDSLTKDNDDTIARKDLSIFRDLDEIDACIASIKSALEGLKFNVNDMKLVIGGGSSGSHLTMLYTYSRGDKCPMPIKFIMNAVGPVDIKPESWKAFETETDEALDSNLEKGSIEAYAMTELKVSMTSLYWNPYQTMRIANGMCGFPGKPSDVYQASSNQNALDQENEQSTAMTKAGGGQDLLSVTYWIKKNKDDGKSKVPMICVYAGKDRTVGINQYATLQGALEYAGYTKGTDYEYIYFRNADHTEIKESKFPTQYKQLLDCINAWCEA